MVETTTLGLSPSGTFSTDNLKSMCLLSRPATTSSSLSAARVRRLGTDPYRIRRVYRSGGGSTALAGFAGAISKTARRTYAL